MNFGPPSVVFFREMYSTRTMEGNYAAKTSQFIAP